MYANHFIQKLKGTPIPPGILLTNDEIKIARIIQIKHLQKKHNLSATTGRVNLNRVTL